MYADLGGKLIYRPWTKDDDCEHFVYQKHLPLIKQKFCATCIWIAQIKLHVHKNDGKYLIIFVRSIKMRKTIGYLNVFGPVEHGALVSEPMGNKALIFNFVHIV